MPTEHSVAVPAPMRPAFTAIMGLIDPFCHQYLNDEYVALCRELTAALARKRPSPLTRGKPEIWACGIVYALGTVNFLFDKSQKPHVRADELCKAFGVSQSSGANKARSIRDMFGMWLFDPRWSLPSMVDQNPMVWMMKVNGFIVDIREMPREVQEVAYKKGLIPYVPADGPPK
ncbi:MAG: hypothetical protein FJ217_14985 [Ignavibacteria bacterium]|nr:hypothetical protein [Ignavibacteria bacterium]